MGWPSSALRTIYKQNSLPWCQRIQERQRSFGPIGEYFVKHQNASKRSEFTEPSTILNSRLMRLKSEASGLRKKTLPKWFGKPGSPWQNPKTHEFRRAVTLPDDSELLTRHEVQAEAAGPSRNELLDARVHAHAAFGEADFRRDSEVAARQSRLRPSCLFLTKLTSIAAEPVPKWHC